jgi:hypothetical protein
MGDSVSGTTEAEPMSVQCIKILVEKRSEIPLEFLHASPDSSYPFNGSELSEQSRNFFDGL